MFHVSVCCTNKPAKKLSLDHHDQHPIPYFVLSQLHRDSSPPARKPRPIVVNTLAPSPRNPPPHQLPHHHHHHHLRRANFPASSPPPCANHPHFAAPLSPTLPTVVPKNFSAPAGRNVPTQFLRRTFRRPNHHPKTPRASISASELGGGSMQELWTGWRCP